MPTEYSNSNLKKDRIGCSFKEAIEITSLSRATLHRQVKAGRLLVTKVGSRTILNRAQVLSLVPQAAGA